MKPRPALMTYKAEGLIDTQWPRPLAPPCLSRREASTGSWEVPSGLLCFVCFTFLHQKSGQHQRLEKQKNQSGRRKNSQQESTKLNVLEISWPTVSKIFHCLTKHSERKKQFKTFICSCFCIIGKTGPSGSSASWDVKCSH